jgi:anti-sigma factor RsiW
MFKRTHVTDQEIVQALDGELPSRQQHAVASHVMACPACRARRDALRAASFDTGSDYSRDAAASQPADGMSSHDAARERLRLRMAAIENGAGESRPSAFPVPTARFLRWGLTAAALVTTSLLIQMTAPARLTDRAGASAAVEAGTLPVASLTPGATWNVSVAELCDAGAREQREIPIAVRQQVIRAYGVQNLSESQYELDYLITPELGGAPDARNLWPQRYASRVWNAHVKDQLERLLPRLVCEGQLPLGVAQRDIAHDWIAAYKKYFKTTAPLQTEVSFTPDADALTFPVWRPANGPELQLVAMNRR